MSTDREVDATMQTEYIKACTYLGLPEFKGSYEFKDAMIKDYHAELLKDGVVDHSYTSNVGNE